MGIDDDQNSTPWNLAARAPKAHTPLAARAFDSHARIGSESGDIFGKCFLGATNRGLGVRSLTEWKRLAIWHFVVELGRQAWSDHMRRPVQMDDGHILVRRTHLENSALALQVLVMALHSLEAVLPTEAAGESERHREKQFAH